MLPSLACLAVHLPASRVAGIRCCQSTPTVLLGPLGLQCSSSHLEQHPELACPRLVLQARPAKIEEAELEQMCMLLRDTLDRNEPFTVLWDLRQMRPPSRAALRFGVDWMGECAEEGTAANRI